MKTNQIQKDELYGKRERETARERKRDDQRGKETEKETYGVREIYTYNDIRKEKETDRKFYGKDLYFLKLHLDLQLMGA